MFVAEGFWPAKESPPSAGVLRTWWSRSAKRFRRRPFEGRADVCSRLTEVLVSVNSALSLVSSALPFTKSFLAVGTTGTTADSPTTH